MKTLYTKHVVYKNKLITTFPSDTPNKNMHKSNGRLIGRLQEKGVFGSIIKAQKLLPDKSEKHLITYFYPNI